jgi:hypothetical protein
MNPTTGNLTSAAEPNTASGFTTSETSRTPRLSARTLTYLLILMCVAPIITIAIMWAYLPPVYEKQLQAVVQGVDMPDAATYSLPFEDRPPLRTKAKLQVTNTGNADWTQFNIQINKQFGDAYQIYEHREPIKAGESRVLELDAFVSRSGARFDARYNPLRNARIYARLPNSTRATYYYSWEDEAKK